MKRLQGGFTLIELVVVIVVIGILAAITTVTFQGVQDRARSTASLAAADQWSDTVQLRLVRASPPRDGTGMLGQGCLTSSSSTFPVADGFADGSCIDISGTSGLDALLDSANPWAATSLYAASNWWTDREGAFDGRTAVSTMIFANNVKLSMRGVYAYIIPHGYSATSGVNSAFEANSGDPYIRLLWITSSSGSCGKGEEDTAWPHAMLGVFGIDSEITSGKACHYDILY